MLIDYSQRAFELLFRPLSKFEKEEIFDHFKRVGEMMKIEELPKNYSNWEKDRLIHLLRDLEYTPQTRILFEQYRTQLGEWRFRFLLDVQALIVPHRVRRLLKLRSNNPLSYLIWSYRIVDGLGLQPLARQILLPPDQIEAVERLNRCEAI